MSYNLNIDIEEKEFQDLIEIWLRRHHCKTRIEIFREINVAGSQADMVVFSPYAKGIITVYELKMYWDKDIKRLKRQVNDYLKVANFVYVVVFGKVPDYDLPNCVNIISVNMKNGRMNFNYIIQNRINPDDNINIKSRYSFMKYMSSLWTTKAFYANKIVGVIERKILREEKKLEIKEVKDNEV